MPAENEIRNKYRRIVQNAGMLYLRMLITMGVTLYTSRVVLQTLGVEDFGIYHVVAGFVTMLGFLHGAMTSATQRFLAYELGRGGEKKLRGIFSMSMNIHIMIGLFVLLIGETLGVWFLKNYLTIPESRINAAWWVYQMALLAFMISIISVPYSALIIAHERMSIFAWVGIIDVTLKLLAVMMLGWFGMDSLILYGLLSFFVAVIVFMIYRSYSKHRFIESRFKIYWDSQLFWVMLSYTGWNLWGNLAAVMSSQGVNILLNIFFGPTVNAARTIAMQVAGALSSFVQSLQMAVNPQIIKSYAANEMYYMHQLVCYVSKYNFFLILILALPILNNTDIVLKTWLGIVPPQTEIFVKLILIILLIDSLSPPLMTAAQATGHIKLYQILVGGILLLNVPISYFMLRLGYQPESVFTVGIGLALAALLVRIIIISKLIDMKVSQYLKQTILPVGLVGCAVFFLNYMVLDLFDCVQSNFFISLITSSALVVLAVLLLGLKRNERALIGKVVSKGKRGFRF